MKDDVDYEEISRPIILIFLGKKLPSYFTRNIYYLCRIQNREVILLTDTVPSSKLMNIRNLKIFDATVYFDGWITAHRSSYRSFFWDKTIKRLYVLFRFLIEKSIEECIHIEGDVWIAPYANLDFKLEKNSCIYPEMSKGRGIGSIMFIQNEGSKTALEALRLMHIFRNQTDMELLGSFLRAKPEMFRVLPSIPIPGESALDLYDGAALGMHLFGEHSRNRFGYYKLFRQYEEMGLDWATLNFEFRPPGLLIVKSPGHDYLINTLHLHSKSKKLFSRNWDKSLRNQVKKRNMALAEKSRFSLVGLVEALFDYSKLLSPYVQRKLRDKIEES